MAETVAAATGDATERPAMDAEQYEAALAHLERVQELLDNLRATIPSVVAPIRRQTSDRGQLFVEIKSAATEAVNNVQTLRNTWISEQTQEVLSLSKNSLAKDSDLSKARQIPRYGWAQDST